MTDPFVDFDWDFSSNYSELQLERWKNSHKEDDFEHVVGICVCVFSILGIFGNIVVIILSFGHVKGDFRHFVANLAVVDIVCGLLFAFMGYINVNKEHQIPSEILNYAFLAFYGSFGVMICALVPISVSRVIALTKPAYYNLMTCCVDHNQARTIFHAFATITVLAYFVAFTTNYMVFRIVARHIDVVQNLRDQVRLLETRQVAIATLAQAFIPLVCQVPAFLTLSSVLLLSEPVTNEYVITIIQLWLALSPLLDSIITILVIKQYRKECLMCASFVSKKMWKPRKTNAIYRKEEEAFETHL